MPLCMQRQRQGMLCVTCGNVDNVEQLEPNVTRDVENVPDERRGGGWRRWWVVVGG
jgi:hypothetical protein